MLLTARDEVVNRYYPRRALPYWECERLVARWITLTWRQDHVCVSGAFVDREPNERNWIWQRLRTKIGMLDWFDRP